MTLLPAVVLFLLAPFVSEFLLGDLPLTMLPALIVLAPMYGGGALVIREIVRRSRRGWPTLMVLALAYSVLEEAYTTQTLFNPNYLHLSLHQADGFDGHSAAGAEESVVSDFLKAAGEHVLQETADELHRLQRHFAPTVGA